MKNSLNSNIVNLLYKTILYRTQLCVNCDSLVSSLDSLWGKHKKRNPAKKVSALIPIPKLDLGFGPTLYLILNLNAKSKTTQAT